MNFNLCRNLHAYYLVILGILLTSLGFGVYFYWEKGPANIENVTDVYEATLKVDEMQSRNQVHIIDKAADSDRVREAVRLIDELEEQARKIQSIAPVDSFTSFIKEVENTQESLERLLSFPEQSTVVLVFNNKMDKFKELVTTNNWRTLTRISQRIQARVSTKQVQTPEFFSHDKMNGLVKSLTKELNTMESVTKNSVLSNADKNQIYTGLETLQTELQMMGRYTAELGNFKEQVKNLESTYKKWFSEIEPAISLKRIKFERSSQTILFSFIGIIAFIFAAAALGAYLYSKSKRQAQKWLEKTMVSTIRDGLIPIEGELPEGLSNDFCDEIDKFRGYIHKRMSFGSIFQDAMPFSSTLLDSNLNVVWANSLFYEHWDLKEPVGSEETLTWDFLQQYTNLGDDDPVVQALKENLAGIYHIQIKKDDGSEARPFEMYVSPVEYAGQKRIMVIFYPLASMEQTLADQTRSLVGPVKRTLDALMEGAYTTSFKQKIEKDFEIAGIPHIHEKFLQYNQVNIDQKNALVSEIENLELHIERQVGVFEQLILKIKEEETIQKETMQSFNEVKEDVIGTVELRKNLESLYVNTANASKLLLKDEFELLKTAKNVGELLEENVKAFEAISIVRDEFKELKSHVDKNRTQLLQLLDQLLVFQKHEGTHTKIEEGLGKIKHEIKHFDHLLKHFSKVATQFDVGLSKVSMILENNSIPDLKKVEQSFQNSRDHIENDLYDVKVLMDNGEAKDEQIIHSLKQLFVSFKKSIHSFEDMGDVLLTQELHEKKETLPGHEIIPETQETMTN